MNKSCLELIQEATEAAKKSNPVPVPIELQGKIKEAWWQIGLLMVQYHGEWAEPTTATDEVYQLLTCQRK